MDKQYKAIIFDLDGVLCFTDKYHYLAWKQIADQLKISFDEKKNDRLRGVSRMQSLEIILEEYKGSLTETEKEKLADEKNKKYREYLMTMTEKDLTQEVKDTLETFRAKGILMAVGSSSKNAELIIQRLGIERYFDAVVDGNEITKSKPDPEVFLRAAEKLRLQPEECLVVEDAQAGILAAKAGGFDSAGLGSAVKDIGATYCMESIIDLEKRFTN